MPSTIEAEALSELGAEHAFLNRAPVSGPRVAPGNDIADVLTKPLHPDVMDVMDRVLKANAHSSSPVLVPHADQTAAKRAPLTGSRGGAACSANFRKEIPAGAAAYGAPRRAPGAERDFLDYEFPTDAERAAALLIQSAYRAMPAKRELRWRRVPFVEPQRPQDRSCPYTMRRGSYAEAGRAATTIQSAYRAMPAKRELRWRRVPYAEPPPCRGPSSIGTGRDALAREERAAVRIQSAYRAMPAKRELRWRRVPYAEPQRPQDGYRQASLGRPAATSARWRPAASPRPAVERGARAAPPLGARDERLAALDASTWPDLADEPITPPRAESSRSARRRRHKERSRGFATKAALASALTYALPRVSAESSTASTAALSGGAALVPLLLLVAVLALMIAIGCEIVATQRARKGLALSAAASGSRPIDDFSSVARLAGASGCHDARGLLSHLERRAPDRLEIARRCSQVLSLLAALAAFARLHMYPPSPAPLRAVSALTRTAAARLRERATMAASARLKCSLNDSGASAGSLNREADFFSLDKTAPRVPFITPSGATIYSEGLGVHVLRMRNLRDQLLVDVHIPTRFFPDMPDELCLTSVGTMMKGGLYLDLKNLEYTNRDGDIAFRVEALDSGPELGYLFPWTEEEQTKDGRAGPADRTVILDFGTHERGGNLTYETPVLAPMATRSGPPRSYADATRGARARAPSPPPSGPPSPFQSEPDQISILPPAKRQLTREEYRQAANEAAEARERAACVATDKWRFEQGERARQLMLRRTIMPVSSEPLCDIDTTVFGHLRPGRWAHHAVFASCVGPDFAADGYGPLLSKALTEFDTSPLDTVLMLVLPHRPNAPWASYLSYFDVLEVFRSGTPCLFSEPATDFVRCRLRGERQYVTADSQSYVLVYKDRDTTATINPYLELHLLLGCAGKAAVDYAARHQRDQLPAGLRARLPADTTGLTYHCAKCRAVNSRRPPAPARREEQRPFDPASVGSKFYFDTKHIKVASLSGKRYVIGIYCVNSGYAHIVHTERKSDIYEILEAFCADLDAGVIFPRRPSRGRLVGTIFVSDRAGEFMGAAYDRIRERWGFIQLHGGAYKHSDLGPIEGLWSRLEARVRSFFAFAPEIPHTAWPLAWDHAAWIHNRTASRGVASQHAGDVRPPPLECVTGEPASLAHALPFGKLVICHNAVEAPARSRHELGKMAPRGRLGHFVGFDDVGNSFLIYDTDKDEVFSSPWAIADTSDIVTCRVVSDFSPDGADAAETVPGFLAIDPPAPLDDELRDFRVERVLSIGTMFIEEESEIAGVVEFARPGAGRARMQAKNFLRFAADLNDAWATLTAFLKFKFVSSANVYYPTFARTDCIIDGAPYDSIIVSTDSRPVERAFGVVAFEFDEEHRVSVADYHDAARGDLRLLAPRMMAMCSTPSLAAVSANSKLNTAPAVPRTVEQALLSPEAAEWSAAIEHEIEGMFDKRRALVPIEVEHLSAAQIARSCKLTWVFKRKMKKGVVVGYRARLCAQGFSQTYGVNYNRTSASVAAHTTFMLILNISIQMALIARHYDVEKAYLTAELPEPILCRFPPGQAVNNMNYCNARMCVYGLKQAGHHWGKLCNELILRAEPRFTRNKTDACLYHLFDGNLIVFLVSNTDDFAVFSSDEKWYDQFESAFAKTDAVLTCEGQLDRWCGQDLTWNADGSVDITQHFDVMASVTDVDGMGEMKVPTAPLETNFHALSVAEPTANENNKLHDRDYTFPYKSGLGIGHWFSRRCYPHVRAAMTMLSTFTAAPTRFHVRCLRRTLKYLESRSRDAIHIARDPSFDPKNMSLACFTDADWAADRVSRRSMSGHVLYLNDCLLSFGCKYHPTQSLSTMEAEYMGEVTAAKEILLIIYIVLELSPYFNIATPVPLFGDNQAALKFAEERCVNDRVKHIDLRHHWLLRHVEEGLIQMNFVGTEENIADLFTKPLRLDVMDRLLAYIVGPIQPRLRELITQLLKNNKLRHRHL